jgi:hypothetical protein
MDNNRSSGRGFWHTATVLAGCLTPQAAQTDNLSRPDSGKCDKLAICRAVSGTAEELLHRRTLDTPTAPDEGRRRNLSRRYKKIGAGNPNLMYLRQKSKPHLLVGNCVLSPASRAPRLNRGRTPYAYTLPTDPAWPASYV